MSHSQYYRISISHRCKYQSTLKRALMTVGSLCVVTEPVGCLIKLTFTKWPLSDVTCVISDTPPPPPTNIPLNVNELRALCGPPIDFAETSFVIRELIDRLH